MGMWRQLVEPFLLSAKMGKHKTIWPLRLQQGKGGKGSLIRENESRYQTQNLLTAW